MEKEIIQGSLLKQQERGKHTEQGKSNHNNNNK